MGNDLAGKKVAFLGTGKMGGIILQALLKSGLLSPASTCATVAHEERANTLATKLGAMHAVNATRQDPVEFARSMTGGRGADVVLEAAGHPVAFGQTTEAVRVGGQEGREAGERGAVAAELRVDQQAQYSVPAGSGHDCDLQGRARQRGTGCHDLPHV